MKKEYYVYEWIRLDTNETFYVGKGKGDRAYDLKNNRNKYFKDVIKNREVAVVILKDNLIEKESFQYECWYIHEYKYEIGLPLTNQTDGGEGVAGWFDNLTEKGKKRYSEKMTKILYNRYKNNPKLRLRISESCKKSHNTEEYIEFARTKGKNKHKENPDFFKEISNNYWIKDESRVKASEHTKKLWANEATRNKILQSRKDSESVKVNVHRANSIRFKDGGNPNAKEIKILIDNRAFGFKSQKEAIKFLNDIGIILKSDKTKKPLKLITNDNFKKIKRVHTYIDYNGREIKIID